MLVSQLEDRLAGRNEVATEISVNDLHFNDLATKFSVGTTEYDLDEVAERALAKFFSIPATYLKNCPSLFKAQTLKFWRDEYSDADVVVHTLAEHVIAVNGPEVITLPTPEIGKIIGRVFDADDQVNFLRGTDYLQFDVVSEAHQIDVPNPLSIPFRPEVGDITKGGVRFLVYPHTIKAPSAMGYFERLTCTNGMCTEEKLGRINLRGNTVPEILAELEAKARYLMGQIDGGLKAYAQTAAERVPGTLQAFAYQLGKEYKLPKGVMDEVMSIINQLPEEATVYDVNQAFTTVANRDVTNPVRHHLQTLGGALALQSGKMIQRCGSCERLL